MAQPRGILKTSVSIAARKEVERIALLGSTRRELVLKGKSALVRALSAERQVDVYEPTTGVETTSSLAGTFVDGTPVFLQCWEASLDVLRGPPLHADIVLSGAHAILVVFDASEDEAAGYAALGSVDALRDELETLLFQPLGDSLPAAGAGYPLYLIAHKADGAVLRAATAAASAGARPAGSQHVAMLPGRMDAAMAGGAPTGGGAAPAPAAPSNGAVAAGGSTQAGGGRGGGSCGGLDSADLSAYGREAGFRRVLHTTTPPPARARAGGGAAPLAAAAAIAAQALLAAVLDDALEYWGFVDAAARPRPPTSALRTASDGGGGDAVAGVLAVPFYDIAPTLTALSAAPPTLPSLRAAVGGGWSGGGGTAVGGDDEAATAGVGPADGDGGGRDSRTGVGAGPGAAGVAIGAGRLGVRPPQPPPPPPLGKAELLY